MLVESLRLARNGVDIVASIDARMEIGEDLVRREIRQIDHSTLLILTNKGQQTILGIIANLDKRTAPIG